MNPYPKRNKNTMLTKLVKVQNSYFKCFETWQCQTAIKKIDVSIDVCEIIKAVQLFHYKASYFLITLNYKPVILINIPLASKILLLKWFLYCIHLSCLVSHKCIMLKYKSILNIGDHINTTQRYSYSYNYLLIVW